MSSLDIREEPLEGVQGVVVLHLDGVLDQPTLGDFLGTLETTRDAGHVRVLLNMEGISYANSTALGALVTQADAFRDAGGEMVLFKPHPKVELVIDMLGLGALFKVFATADEANAYIAGAGTGVAATAATAAASAVAQAAPAAQVATATAVAEPPPAPTPAGPGTVFPLRAECIGCGIVLEFSQASHFR